MTTDDSRIIKSFERRVEDVWRMSGCPSVLVCLSGGVDSVALLVSLLAVVSPDATLMALHCDFHLRGEESERDRKFAEALCQRLDVPLLVKDFDVESYRRDHRCSLETACRELRYEWFRQQAALCPSPVRISTGHHADDNIETLLLNLFRGAGTAGLKGMRPDNGEILRPLLGFSREEILKYLEAKGEAFITDSSNLTSDYRRNFLRNELIPLAETRWPGVRRALMRSQEALAEEAALVDEAVERVLVSPIEVSLDALRESHSPVTLIHRFIAPHGGNTEQAVEMARAIGGRETLSGKLWPMPDGSRISLERECLQVVPANIEAAGEQPVFCWAKVALTKEELEKMKTDRSQLRAWLPRGPEHYRLRKARRGDRLKPLGMKGSRLLSDMMKDAHMSLLEKEAQWVLVDRVSDEIIWVPGLRRSRLDLLSPDAAECHVVSLSSALMQDVMWL